MSDVQAATVTENGVSPAAQETKVEEAPGFKVFAGNLAYSTTDDGLRAFFAPVESEILSAQVILRGTRSAGYGFVALSTTEAAQKAVELLDKKELDGRPVIVEIAKPSDQKDKERKERKAKRRSGRRGAKAVPGEVTDAEANGEAAKTEETPTAASATNEADKPKKKKKKAPRKPKAKGAAPVADTTEGVSAPAAPADGGAQTAEAAPKKPRARKPKAPRPPRPEGEAPSGEPSKNMLFVANLGFNIDDEALKKLFTDAGINVISARIVRRRYGRPKKSKGYGFVDVGNEEEQKKAIAALEGKDVEGRPIAVKVAVNSGKPEDGAEDVTDVAATPAPDAPAAVAA